MTSPVGERAPAGGWRTATVAGVRHPTPHLVVLRLDVPERVDHWPGQHYVVRLRAPDDYTAQRSYSVASAPSDPLLELCVERLPDGEVSGHLAEVVEPGDRLEVRGPIGGWFTWRGERPALAVTGGTGVVPVVAMLRHAAHLGRPELLSVVAAARTRLELPYAAELEVAGARIVLSRESTASRPAGRITAADLPGDRAAGSSYVCGTTGFADTATELLIAGGAAADTIRVERFGETV